MSDVVYKPTIPILTNNLYAHIDNPWLPGI